MKTTVSGFLSLLFILVLSFTGCKKEQQRSLTENDIEFDTITLARNYHLNNDSTMPSCNLRINFTHPVKYKKAELISELNRIFLSVFFDESYQGMLIEEAIEKYAENYISNYKEDAKNFFDEEKYNHEEGTDSRYFSYYENLENEIKYNKADLLSLQIIQNNYKGGKNSFVQYTNYVIDLEEAKIINEKDIFLPDYEKILRTIFIDKIRSVNRGLSIKELEDTGYFGLEEITPNNNFLIDDEGITYIFNKGEYSILQLDEIKLFIPYEEIKNLMREDSPLNIFYKN